MDEKTIEKTGCAVLLAVLFFVLLTGGICLWAFIELVNWITSK